jgi:hypothetical protein
VRIDAPLPAQSTNADSTVQAGSTIRSIISALVPMTTALTVFRQHPSYDPTGGSHAFSLIGFNGTALGFGVAIDGLLPPGHTVWRRSFHPQKPY